MLQRSNEAETRPQFFECCKSHNGFPFLLLNVIVKLKAGIVVVKGQQLQLCSADDWEKLFQEMLVAPLKGPKLTVRINQMEGYFSID